MGNKVTASSWITFTDPDTGEKIYYGTSYSVAQGDAGVSVTDNYIYDNLDRLQQTWRAAPLGTQVLDERKYDGAGRTVEEGPYGNLSSGANNGSYLTAVNQGIDPTLQIGMQTTINAYDTHGQVTSSRVLDASGGLASTSDMTYDAMGNLKTQSTVGYNGQQSQNVSNTATRVLEGYQVTSSITTGDPGTDTTTTVYDVNGAIRSFSVSVFS